MNRITGVVRSVTGDELFVRVDVDVCDDTFSACILRSDSGDPVPSAGSPVTLVFKEADTILASGNPESVSCRNRFAAKVASVTEGAVLTRVVADYDGIPLVSLITTGSAQSLGIKPGDDIVCMVKSTSVMLGTERHDAR